jgi:hypothetical protein
MSRRALHGGLVVVLLSVGLLVADARSAGADTGLGMRAWRWLVSVWDNAGPEIDPNGNHLQTPPTPPPPPAGPSATGGGAQAGSVSGTPGEHQGGRLQPRRPR